MKYLISLTTCLLVGSFCFAQVHEIQQTRNALQTVQTIGLNPNKTSAMVRGFDSRYKGVLGTPYLSADWIKGTLEEKTGDVFHDIYLRYNMVSDVIEMQSMTGKRVTLTKAQIVAFSLYLAETDMHFQVFEDPEPAKKNKDPYFYAQVINSGPMKLLIRRRKYLAPRDNSISPYHTQVNDIYKYRGDKYYVIFKGEAVPRRLRKNKKQLLSLMADHADEIKKFIKINYLNVGNDNHLTLIIDHYNELALATAKENQP
ncbi:MAG: hypothetical protein AAFR61_28750 [Bacteroidota bacterium]